VNKVGRVAVNRQQCSQAMRGLSNTHAAAVMMYRQACACEGVLCTCMWVFRHVCSCHVYRLLRGSGKEVLDGFNMVKFMQGMVNGRHRGWSAMALPVCVLKGTAAPACRPVPADGLTDLGCVILGVW
jgi:hypothetical protein